MVMSRSLTLRLSLLFAAVSTVVMLALGGTIGYLVEEHFEMLDSMELGGKMTLVRHTLARLPAPVLAASLRWRLDDALIGHEGLMVSIVAADGTRWYATPGADFPTQLVHAHDAAADHHAAKPLVWQQQGRHLRGIVAPQVSIAGLPPLTIAIGLDTAHHREFMDDFRKTLWASVVLGVLLSSLLGWFVARRGLRPIGTIAGVARGISAERLNDRLPLARVPVELEELAAAFNDMLARLEDSFRRLSEFSSDIAHELRTPLSNLMTQTQVAMSKSRSAEEYREILYSNLEEYERLARMVSDMLFLAKADNGLLIPERERIDVARTVDALLEFYRALAEEGDVSMSRSGEGEMIGDALMMRRAISNLLSNAIRHATPGGRIGVDVSTAAMSTRIAVENSGDSIAPQYLDRLFDRFYRVDPSRSRSSEGSGLGLAIAKSIVEAHGGSIAVTSAQAATRFVITVPAATGSPQPEPGPDRGRSVQDR